jgi:hypothetical protein
LAELFGFTETDSVPPVFLLEMEAKAKVESARSGKPATTLEGLTPERPSSDSGALGGTDEKSESIKSKGRTSAEIWLLGRENRCELPIHTSAVDAVRGLTLQRVAEEARIAGMLSAADAFVSTCEERNVKIIPFGFSFPESV